MQSMDRGHPVDVADRVEATTRRTSPGMADRMEPTVRDHSAEMVGRTTTVVRVDGVDLLEVEDETEQAREVAEGSVGRLGRKSRVLSLFWHIPVDVRLGGGGCREDFRPEAENLARGVKVRCATLHIHFVYL